MQQLNRQQDCVSSCPVPNFFQSFRWSKTTAQPFNVCMLLWRNQHFSCGRTILLLHTRNSHTVFPWLTPWGVIFSTPPEEGVIQEWELFRRGVIQEGVFFGGGGVFFQCHRFTFDRVTKFISTMSSPGVIRGRKLLFWCRCREVGLIERDPEDSRKHGDLYWTDRGRNAYQDRFFHYGGHMTTTGDMCSRNHHVARNVLLEVLLLDIRAAGAVLLANDAGVQEPLPIALKWLLLRSGEDSCLMLHRNK